MNGLIIILGLLLLFLVVRSYLRVRREKKLRDDYPERKVIEVTLPKGTKDSRFLSAGFWAKVASSTSSDPKARKQGVGQIDFKYIAERPGKTGTPVLRCLITADADRMDSVKRAVKTVFEDAMVVELETDPLRVLAESFRDAEGVEPEHRHQ